ncbi:hypothetical protein NIES4071_110030 (plasmid) [Calothrix sp. NIES-4071]|nr:hypothetical protein NIES4071_110030 [Calothrix sp. NIES-4071]BAZ65264.1 hypothetical protein NIES4105_109970 [Calothrix sp. NIES-4105]
MAIQRVKKLVASAYYELEELIWYQQLINLALKQENLDDMELLLDTYRPIGENQLLEIKHKLELIKEELKIK